MIIKVSLDLNSNLGRKIILTQLVKFALVAESKFIFVGKHITFRKKKFYLLLLLDEITSFRFKLFI